MGGRLPVLMIIGGFRLRLCRPGGRPPGIPPQQRMPHPRQPLRLCRPGGSTPRDPPAAKDAAFAAVVKDKERSRYPAQSDHENFLMPPGVAAGQRPVLPSVRRLTC